MKVTVIAGGVGGARMALGFAQALPGTDLSVLVNVGDDERFHGLYVCPDLDTVLYTLTGRVDRQQGWGVAGDTTRGLEVLRELQSPGAWMKLGDADLGLHIYRTSLLAQGLRLTEATQRIARGMGLSCTLLPVTDAESPTIVETAEGLLRFQEWFVRDRAMPTVRALRFDAARRARVTPEAAQAVQEADLVVVAPSNPFLSIQPMLEVAGMREALAQATAPIIAISPLVGGRAIKGPLVQLMQDLGSPSSHAEIARMYADWIDVLVVDASDAAEAAALRVEGKPRIAVMPTLIAEPARSQALAQALMEGWTR